MKSSRCRHWAFFLLPILVFGMVAPGIAGELTDQMTQTTDTFLSILRDPALKEASKTEEREGLIRKTLDERFDWEEMASRSLSRYWGQRTEEEKKEFVHLYADLVKRTYVSKVVEGYSGEKVFYEGENIARNYGTLKVKIVTKKNKDILLEFSFKRAGNNWLIYDVSFEGVSLVKNYRAQFDSIMSKVSYANMVKMLKDKANGT